MHESLLNLQDVVVWALDDNQSLGSSTIAPCLLAHQAEVHYHLLAPSHAFESIAVDFELVHEASISTLEVQIICIDSTNGNT